MAVHTPARVKAAAKPSPHLRGGPNKPATRPGIPTKPKPKPKAQQAAPARPGAREQRPTRAQPPASAFEEAHAIEMQRRDAAFRAKKRAAAETGVSFKGTKLAKVNAVAKVTRVPYKGKKAPGKLLALGVPTEQALGIGPTKPRQKARGTSPIRKQQRPNAAAKARKSQTRKG